MRARLILALSGAALISACHTGDFPDYPDARMNILAPPPAPPPPPPPPPEIAPPRALPGIAPLTEDNIGPYMDRQEAELRRALRDAGIRVVREGDNLILTIDEDIIFAHDSAVPDRRARDTVGTLAAILRTYRATYVDVDGFTDTTGAFDYNIALSQARADSIADLLMREGVSSARVNARGFGERNLRVPTPDGVPEPLNRRVEITLEPYLG